MDPLILPILANINLLNYLRVSILRTITVIPRVAKKVLPK